MSGEIVREALIEEQRWEGGMNGAVESGRESTKE